MFHFPTFPPHALYIQARVTRHDSGRVSPFGHPRITARLPAPRGLSQATTSFFGSWCQGIHRMLLKTCHKRSKMLASTVQFSNNAPTPDRTPHQHQGDRTRNGHQKASHHTHRHNRQTRACSLRTQQHAQVLDVPPVSELPGEHSPPTAATNTHPPKGDRVRCEAP